MPEPAVTRRHLTRLRQVYRSSGWPCHDPIEVDLRVAGLLEAVTDAEGRETLRVTPTGLRALSAAHADNRASRSAHDDLVMRIAAQVQREGRVAWAGLALRAQVNGAWVQAMRVSRSCWQLVCLAVCLSRHALFAQGHENWAPGLSGAYLPKRR